MTETKLSADASSYGPGGVPLQKVVGINIVFNIHNRKALCANRNGGSDNHMGGAHTYMHKWVMLWQEEMLFKRPRDFCSL